MKKHLFLIILGFIVACKKETTSPAKNEPSVAKKINRVWVATQITEGSSVVFAKSSSNNIKAGYAQFKLDLSNAISVSLTEFDGNTFSGQYELPNDKTLNLKNLSPQPTGTNGMIEFSITEISSNVLKLSRVTNSAKTGGEVVTYVLE